MRCVLRIKAQWRDLGEVVLDYVCAHRANVFRVVSDCSCASRGARVRHRSVLPRRPLPQTPCRGFLIDVEVDQPLDKVCGHAFG